MAILKRFPPSHLIGPGPSVEISINWDDILLEEYNKKNKKKFSNEIYAKWYNTGLTKNLSNKEIDDLITLLENQTILNYYHSYPEKFKRLSIYQRRSQAICKMFPILSMEK
jgi:hypothetical protein